MTDESYEKAIGQLRMKLNLLLNPLRLYGQGPYVDHATAEIVSLAQQFHQRVCGVDQPFTIKEIPWG